MAEAMLSAQRAATFANAENDVKEELRPAKRAISVNDDSQSDRILRKGDLVRILDSTPTKPKLKNHIGNLGKIVRSIPVEDPGASHPFLYDIEFILGGKVSGVERCDLQYTTAEAEGMIGNLKRKRTKNAAFVPSPEKDKIKDKKPTPPKKKTPAAKKTAAGKKRGPTGNAGKGKAKKSKPSKAEKVEYAAPSTNLNLYERHRREFERCVGRLEKADTFHWFMGEVPPEYDEPDTTESDTVGKRGNAPQGTTDPSASPIVKKESSSNDENLTAPPPTDALSAANPDASASASAIIEKADKSKFEIRSPDNPPYNFEILRKRIARGRYVLDEEALENKHHRALIKPYVKSLGNTTKEDRAKRSKARAKLNILHPKAVDWDLFRADVIAMCDTSEKRDMECDDGSSGTISYACRKIKETLEQIYEKTGKRQLNEIRAANTRHRFASAIESFSNNEAAVQGRWRKEAFPYRRYERLKTDVVCAGLSELDERIATYELKTNLKDSFVGLSYVFDDTEKSEGWMKSILSDSGGDRKQRRRIASALQSDNGVIKAQVEATMQSLLIAVQDRVMTDLKVLEQPELRNASWMTSAGELPNEILSGSILCDGDKAPEIVEQPVWGIDCYTRRNVSICLETAIDAGTALIFVEKWLLPAINACPVEIAHNIANAARILEGLPFESDPSVEENSISMEQWRESLLGKALLNKIAQSGPPWLKFAAQVLRKACEALGSDFFRVHPKGHGSIVLCPKLEANKLVTFYRGEVYPSWRWGEKMDAISTIQEKKGLKPVLPDFFNMALERPMKDPRGYGLLFCDASRKSGYGSMLSHSCKPSCEVRVAAVNGMLTLAMTTLREMTIGDELTFDYNAVTESLNEYRSAVCLCGHGGCRGSFLHFATADCYQQVLNRNSPMAVRVANLIKGCMKKVMSEDDQEVLKRHGFQTAAFGAVSVNRRRANRSTAVDLQLDSMEFVPIWLQTYVADTLRYIEYERRALPIALICNELYPENKEGGDSGRSEEESESSSDEDDDKPIKGAKPEPAFFFYSRIQKSHFVSLLMEDSEHQNLTGIELKKEVQKLASSHWKSLGEDEKEDWKKKARQEWVKNGGQEKAKLERERVARLAKGKSKAKDKKGGNKDKAKAERSKGSGKRSSKKEEQKVPETKMTFQAADAEGISAMEQRIQQLTQTLSRVGRVLDRHREAIIRQENDKLLCSDDNESSAAAIRQLVHSPLSIMPDEHIVAWVWNHDDGVVKVLLKCIAYESCVSPKLRKTIINTASKYSALEKFGRPWLEDFKPAEEAMSPAEGRKCLNDALMELRSNILDGIDEMAAEIKKYRSSNRKEAARKKKTEDTRNEVKAVMNDLIKGVEMRLTGIADSTDGIIAEDEVEMNDSEDVTPEWMQKFNKRFKLEKAADILLMYACTSTFFALKSYQPLQSSPVEVYARELGNEVPTSAIDTPSVDATGEENFHAETSSEKMDVDNTTASSKKAKCGLCEPDDIIAEVAVKYQGDYVVSQLLQWYNAGIDQKPGLPDLLGCVMLPTLEGIWSIDGTQGSSSRTDRATGYKSIIRPRLVDWFKDPLKRGSPWPDDLRRAFIEKADDKPISDASNLWRPIGSPVLDFLVTGEDVNINSILQEMGGRNVDHAVADSSGMFSSVDHGRPALAVSNWVQCENPDCLKWRKLPWHVDIDTLDEKFYCKDNIWNPQSASCDAPEDQWDETTDGLVDADGSAPIAPPDEDVEEDSSSDEEDSEVHGLEAADFNRGGRFDVMNTAKSKWIVGVVVDTRDEDSRRKVKIHFLNHSVKYDEWIRAPSSRIAPLYSMTQEPSKRKEKKQQQNLGENDESNSVDEHSSETEDVQATMEDDGAKENEAKVTRGRPTAVSDESSVIHSPAKDMVDFSIYSSEDEENEPVESKTKMRLKKLITKKSKSREEPEESPPSPSMDESESESFEPATGKKAPKNQIPRKKTWHDESEVSTLQPLDKEENKQKKTKQKKTASTFKPLIPRKRPQDKVQSAAHTPNGGSLIPRKSPAKPDQGLTSLMKSDTQGAHHSNDGRLKAHKPHSAHEKQQDQKMTPSRKGWNPAGSPDKQIHKTDGESRSRMFDGPRGSASANSPRHRAIVDDKAGAVIDDRRSYGETDRARPLPPNEDSRGSFDDRRGPRRSAGDNLGAPSSGDGHERYAERHLHTSRNDSLPDEGRNARPRWTNEEGYAREYSHEYPRDYDRDVPRERSREYERSHRAPDDYSRDGGRERPRQSGRDYDRVYSRSPDRGYSREYDGSEYKYSRERGYYRDDDDYRGRSDQGYIRDEGKEYARRYDDEYDRYDDRDYRRGYERDYDRHYERDYRRYDQDYAREDDREYRRHYDRQRDGEKRRESDRQSGRPYDRGNNRSQDRESFREEYSGGYERQRPRSNSGRNDSPIKRRY